MPPQQQQQSGGDDSLAPVWITLLFLATIYLIWFFAHQHIVAFVFKLTVWQGKLVTFFVNDPKLTANIYLMETIDPITIKWDQFIALIASVGNYLRYPFIVVLSVLGIWLYSSNIKLKFRKVHDMKTLRAQEQRNWTAIMPIVKEDLVEADINKGPWAMGMSPMEFARRHQLLRKDDAILDAPMPGMEMTAGVRRGDAKRVFTLQLGPYFDGFDKCPPHVCALAAVFVARISRDRAAATMIINTLNITWSQGKPNYAIARPVLKKYMNTELVQEVIARHAYLLTVMASLLEAARDDGVVPCSEFLWLKPTDRRLWYMLNCVGRQTPYSEVAGPFAHWKAEKSLGRPSLVPMIDEATRALEIAIKEVKLTPKELHQLEP
jgi:intracellular multiplication protein IcmP